MILRGESRGDPYNEWGKEIQEEPLSSKSGALKNMTLSSGNYQLFATKKL